MVNSKEFHHYQTLTSTLSLFEPGASIEKIEAHLTSPPTRRTLQRWLVNLINAGLVTRTGQGRATKYVVAQPRMVQQYRVKKNAVKQTLHNQLLTTTDHRPSFLSEPTAPYSAKPQHEVSIPLSRRAKEIEAYVRQPLASRKHVGYNPSFLEDYQPNNTFYLSDDIRQALRQDGHVIDHVEPAGTFALQIANRLLIDLSWNSSRLEGNTYSLLETDRLIASGQAISGKSLVDTVMILNHKDAIEYLIRSPNEIGFNRFTIFNLHAMLSDDLLEDPSASGRLRNIAVGIGQTSFTPLNGPQRIELYFEQMLSKVAAIEDPFEQAFFVMVHLPYLQPFVDVNKRVSRIAANIPLIQRNLCPLSFINVPQSAYISGLLGVYELNQVDLLRDVFVWAYQKSCARYSEAKQVLGEPDGFRMQYRSNIVRVVSSVVQQKMNKQQAVVFVQQHAVENIKPEDQNRFIEAVDNQLLSLHEGSISRYRLRLSEYQSWQKAWF
jgi:fido (protein-threonine AMPylation protein)